MYVLIAVAGLGVVAYFGWLKAVLALAFLIIVHEAGHYFVARWCGMRVDRFSIGFGPAIKGLSWRSKGGTLFQLAPIPFGGFVEIRGMNIVEEVDPDDVHAYPNRPAWQRFLTILAGPATNYISAVILAFGLYTCHGVPSTERWYGVVDVLPGLAAAGKLEAGDRIITVDGVKVLANDGSPGLTARVVAKQGAPLVIGVLRMGRVLEVAITPRLVTTGSIGALLRGALASANGPAKVAITKWSSNHLQLGISFNRQHDVIDIGIIDGAGRALVYPIEQTKAITNGLYGIIARDEEADPGGPIRIAEEFKSAFDFSLVAGIELVMMLSVYLGMFNLFPIPALDGGRLVFLGYEMITRRRANPKIEAMVHMGGIMVLGVLMILVTFKDCGRFF